MIRGSGALFLKFLVFLTIAVGAAGGAVAQQSPAQCAAINDDGERLACYDALFRSGTAEGAAEPVVIESERMIPARPTGRRPAVMTVACGEAGPEVRFTFAGQFVSNTGDIAAMTYQVDSGATLVRTMRADETNTELTFATPQETATFLEGLAGATNVKVRMTPVRQRSLTLDFRVDAVADEIAALQTGCAG